MVTDLRTLSLADAGELSLHRELLPPHELLRAYSAWQTQAQQRQIGLEHHAPTDLPAISVDPERMMQVLNNLISNAMRYTPAGGKIVLAARLERKQILLTVQDNGAGIAVEHLPLVFDRFYRVDPARQENSGESGLGLAIARSIVEIHGGSLWVESDGIGQGATFMIRLPVTVGLGSAPPAP